MKKKKKIFNDRYLCRVLWFSHDIPMTPGYCIVNSFPTDYSLASFILNTDVIHMTPDQYYNRLISINPLNEFRFIKTNNGDLYFNIEETTIVGVSEESTRIVLKGYEQWALDVNMPVSEIEMKQLEFKFRRIENDK